MRRILFVASITGLAMLTGITSALTGTDNTAEAGYRYGYRRPVARAVARGAARVVVGAPVYRPYGYGGYGYNAYRPYAYPGYGYGYGPGVGVGFGMY